MASGHMSEHTLFYKGPYKSWNQNCERTKLTMQQIGMAHSRLECYRGSFTRLARAIFMFVHFCAILVLSMMSNDSCCIYVDDVGT